MVFDDDLVKQLLEVARFYLGQRVVVVLTDEGFDVPRVGDVDVVYDYFAYMVGQEGHCFMNDAVDEWAVEQAGGAVHEVGQIDGHDAVLAVVDAAGPEFVEFGLVAQAGD